MKNARKSMRLAQIVIVSATIGLFFPIRGASAATIPVVGALDCSGGTICTITGIGGNPLFSGNASTGDVLHITFAGGAFFTPVLDDPSLTPWEVSMGGAGSNGGDDFAVTMYLSDSAGDPATSSAGLHLDGLLGGSDGVNFSSLPNVYDVEIEIGFDINASDLANDIFVPGIANFTLDSFSVFDRPNEGPVITFVQGPSAVPLPATLPLFGIGLGAFGLLGWRRRRKAAA